MKYKLKSFTVPASEGDGSFCREKGHSAPDIRGRCLSCGAKVGPTAAETVSTFQQLRGTKPNFIVHDDVADASIGRS